MTPRVLLHFAAEPITELVSRDPVAGWADGHPRHDKPGGLWVSDEINSYGWSRWCLENDWTLGEHVYEVALADDANILEIATPEELLAFNARYELPIYPDIPGMGIEWAAVGREYQGILITPYQWTMRLDSRLHWYYTWDCASGCIWDVTAIQALRPIEFDRESDTV